MNTDNKPGWQGEKENPGFCAYCGTHRSFTRESGQYCCAAQEKGCTDSKPEIIKPGEAAKAECKRLTIEIAKLRKAYDEQREENERLILEKFSIDVLNEELQARVDALEGLAQRYVDLMDYMHEQAKKRDHIVMLDRDNKWDELYMDAAAALGKTE